MNLTFLSHIRISSDTRWIQKKREGSTFTGCSSRIQQLFWLIMNIYKGFGLCTGKDEKKGGQFSQTGSPQTDLNDIKEFSRDN